jgi:hypothetical protein
MGYTHYWYREKEIGTATFKKIVADFNKLVLELNAIGVKLAGPLGEGKPIINNKEVRFNGNAKCGHQHTGEIGIAWPADKTKFGNSSNGEAVIVGSWFAGALLEQRACDGDCSHETFSFPIIFKPNFEQTDSERKELLFDFTKTAFKPYDLAVTIFLVIAQHHLKDKIIISSDGGISQWLDAIIACESALGYGKGFKLRD